MQKILAEQLQILAQNELMLKAIETVFGETIEQSRPEVSDGNNQLLGEKYRSYEYARIMLAKTLNDIKSYKVDDIKSSNFDKSK